MSYNNLTYYSKGTPGDDNAVNSSYVDIPVKGKSTHTLRITANVDARTLQNIVQTWEVYDNIVYRPASESYGMGKITTVTTPITTVTTVRWCGHKNDIMIMM